ncbi:hypothetical protein [Deinococcus pimensis]|uniref:hypothetical protein n=1 Tax=Deinococcus pimensis TaxID=309888 RepID=UPI000481D719|nr:hypothetical protein [Deinococcus pimensis]
MLILTSSVVPRVIHHGSATRHILELQVALSAPLTTTQTRTVRRLLDRIAQTLAGRPAREAELDHLTRHPQHLAYLVGSYEEELLRAFEHVLHRPA